MTKDPSEQQVISQFHKLPLHARALVAAWVMAEVNDFLSRASNTSWSPNVLQHWAACEADAIKKTEARNAREAKLIGSLDEEWFSNQRYPEAREILDWAIAHKDELPDPS